MCINALLRRPGGVLGITLEAGNLRLDTVGRELMIAGAPVRLARQELAILEQMMRRLGRTVPKVVLEEKLYGIDEEPEFQHDPGACPSFAAADAGSERHPCHSHDPGRRLHPHRSQIVTRYMRSLQLRLTLELAALFLLASCLAVGGLIYSASVTANF